MTSRSMMFSEKCMWLMYFSSEKSQVLSKFKQQGSISCHDSGLLNQALETRTSRCSLYKIKSCSTGLMGQVHGHCMYRPVWTTRNISPLQASLGNIVTTRARVLQHTALYKDFCLHLPKGPTEEHMSKCAVNCKVYLNIKLSSYFDSYRFLKCEYC